MTIKGWSRSLLTWISFVSILVLASCSPSARIAKSAKNLVLKDSALRNAHIGVVVYDVASGKYLYDYQGEKYFVPASNTKLPTCYVAMKILGDSIEGLKYEETDSIVYIQPTADPTLLHRDFKIHPAFNFLRSTTKPLVYVLPPWQDKLYGPGWNWSDYAEAYMPEKSPIPVYGNTVVFNLKKRNNKYFVSSDIPFFQTKLNERIDSISNRIGIERRREDNLWDIVKANGNFTSAEIPFQTYENQRLLEDTLDKAWLTNVVPSGNRHFKTIYSQPVDTMLKLMMHRSDNFYAEQSLLMAANRLFGVMSSSRIIDSMLKSLLKDLPQKPRWVDGSGLSRYNLFSPHDLVTILNKMKDEFGMERLKVIMMTGNEGTLEGRYKSDSGYIYAKTGTLSGVVALSGFLYTRSGRQLIFSFLVNNHTGSATPVRDAMERFIHNLRERF